MYERGHPGVSHIGGDDLVTSHFATFSAPCARRRGSRDSAGLETVKRFADTKLRYYPSDEQIPLDFVPPLWRDEVVEQDANGNQRVNRTYEITVLDALRDQVRCKEVWIVGADRYRNPDDDVPADFELRREEHYAALKLPLDPETFIETRSRTERHDRR